MSAYADTLVRKIPSGNVRKMVVASTESHKCGHNYYEYQYYYHNYSTTRTTTATAATNAVADTNITTITTTTKTSITGCGVKQPIFFKIYSVSGVIKEEPMGRLQQINKQEVISVKAKHS